MPISFPVNPILNQVYTNLDRTWKWNGRFWEAVSTSVGFTGSVGYTGSASTAVGPTGNVGYTGSEGVGFTGSRGIQGPQGPIGVMGSQGFGVNWYEFNPAANSPGPLEFTPNYITGFNASNSYDFPGNYYTGITINGNTIGAQIAIGWDTNNGTDAPPSKLYIRANDDTGNVATWSPWRRVLVEPDLEGYLKLDPDGDGISVSYSDQNPTVNGVQCNGGWYFGADGNINAGMLDAKFINARNGHVNSSGGYYVGTMNPLEVPNAGTYTTTQIISSSGQFILTTGNTADKGLKFGNDPGGGSGDTAWLRYFSYGGERTNLEIGVSNDGVGVSQDSINLVSPGGVGINQQSPAESLHVSGTVLTTGTFNSVCDTSVMSTVANIANPLNLVANIRGVTYTEVGSNLSKIGVVASEIESVIPRLVQTNSDGTKSVSYGNFAGLFIESIKALQSRIEDLEYEISKLKGGNPV
jgi:hypothetical protein